MNITLAQIVALIKKLEDENPRTYNMLKLSMYDDCSGEFLYYDYHEESDVTVESFGIHNSLSDLLKKYNIL